MCWFILFLLCDPGLTLCYVDIICFHYLAQNDVAADGGALFLSQTQNKELTFELKNKKRTITDLRDQLQHQKKQSEEAESLLSVLDRSYNQVGAMI